MKILHAHCLHAGEWESYWPSAQEELRQEGRLLDEFPPYHNGAWIWSQVLRELGHDVVEFDYRTSRLLRKTTQVRFPSLYSFCTRLNARIPALNRWDMAHMNEQLLRCARAEKPDIYITYPGERVFPASLKEMQAIGITTVLWLGRDPVFEGTPNVVESFPYYDFVFTIDPPNVEKYKQHGARQVFYLPLGCYEPIHRPQDLSATDRQRYAAPVSFVGTLFDDRPEFLSRLIDLEVNFWTHSWDKQMQRQYPQLTPLYRGPARGLRMLKVLNGSDITINVHRVYNSLTGTNMRTFEAAGCRAFQLVEYKEEIGNLFKIGEEIEVYYDLDDLKHKVKEYLPLPEKRAAMARKAQQRAYAEHTYQQ